jgi:hypothetical protein
MGLILEAACWAHARRPFFALADIEASTRRKADVPCRHGTRSPTA